MTIYTTGSTDTLGYFLNASGGRIALDDDAGSYSNFNIEERVTAGTYYVKVQHNSSGGTGRYTLVVNFTLQRSDDHGNSMNAATTTRLNGRISGSIEVAGDEDWFKVVMPRTGILMIQTLGQTDTVGYLYNADGSQIAADNNGGSGHNFLIIRSVAAGTYYVRVKHPSSSGIGTYWLDISLESDHSNRIDTATSIDLNSTTLGHINKVGDVDWFKIVIPRTGTLVVETTDTTDTKGYLYNASGVQLASNDNISSSNHNFKISKFITVAGTYYVKVRHSGTTGTGIYALVSHFIPNDYGYNVNTATPIALKSTTRGRIEAAGSGDYFKIIIPSGKRGTLIINTTGSTDTYGSLLGGSGAQLALDDNSGSGHNFRISISVTAGTYYAKVRHHSPTGIGSYALVSHFVPDDHTSSRIAATSINPNSTTQGRIEVAGDVDFFKIRIPSSGTLVVKTTGLTDTYGTLLNANGHQIASDDNGSTYSNFRILKSVSTGTYYVKVKHSSASSIGYYTLISQFISDDYGNTRSTAKPINPNSTTQGRIEVDGDVDFFKIQIHSRGTLVVKTTGLTDTYGTLLNANGHQIASDDNGSAYSNFKISKSVTAGTYYVKVKHSSALLAGSYVLVSHFVSDDDHGDSRRQQHP
ncbi:MAG: PPC domain-containing protein [Sulfurovum sp.]|nr:PPC domain-containing protein [Sulfurovum sp.]